MTRGQISRWPLTSALAGVWLVHGLYNKLLGGSPRHLAIVQSVPGLDGTTGRHALVAVGFIEVGIAVWMLSRRAPQTCASVQTVVLLSMNVLELIYARHLVLFDQNFVTSQCEVHVTFDGGSTWDVTALKADLVSISAHKIYGPKGVGALYVRRRNPRVLLAEQISGGGHERGMRSGTLNVTGIVGLGKAAELCRLEMQKDTERLGKLRDRLNEGLHKNLDEIYINGSMEHRLPHNLNISFAYVEGESLLMGINEVAVSSGSACTSASLEPSYVLKALGAGDDLAHSSIRFGLGRWTTEEEVDYVIDKLTKVVRRLREMSPLYAMVKEGVDLSKMQWVTH